MVADVFEFWVENASQHMSSREQDRENKMYRELYARHEEFLQACVGNEFEMVNGLFGISVSDSIK